MKSLFYVGIDVDDNDNSYHIGCYYPESSWSIFLLSVNVEKPLLI